MRESPGPRSHISSARCSPTHRRARSDRRCRALLRRRRRARRARARRRRAARGPAFGHAAGGDRPRVPERRALARSARDGLGTLGVPYAVDGRSASCRRRSARRSLSMLRFAWLGGTRRDLFTFLRSPFSASSAVRVDSSKGAFAGVPCRRPIGSSRKGRAAGSRLPSLAELATPRIRLTRCAGSRPDAPQRLRARRSRRSERRRGSTCEHTRR